MKDLHGKKREEFLQSLSPAARKLALEVERLKARFSGGTQPESTGSLTSMGFVDLEHFLRKKSSRKKKKS